MAKTQAAVIYGLVSRNIRALIIPDDDSGLARVKLAEGEGLLLMPLSLLPGENVDAVKTDAWRAWVAEQIGAPTMSERVVEVDAAGNVIAAYCADSHIDAPANDVANKLVATDKVSIGDRVIWDQVDPGKWSHIAKQEVIAQAQQKAEWVAADPEKWASIK